MTNPKDSSANDRVTLRSLVQAVADAPVSEMPRLRDALFHGKPAGRDPGEVARIGFALASVAFAAMVSWLLFSNQPHPPRGRQVPIAAAAPPPAAVVTQAADPDGQFTPLVDLSLHAGPYRLSEVRMPRVRMAATGVPVDLADADPFVRVQVVYDGAARPVAMRTLHPTR